MKRLSIPLLCIAGYCFSATASASLLSLFKFWDSDATPSKTSSYRPPVPTPASGAKPHQPTWSITQKTQALATAAPNINPHALKLALSAYQCAVLEGQSAQKLLTVVDYSKSSAEKRLWIFDLASNKVLFNSLVAHGSGSGDTYPTRFSNAPETHASSLGLFRTGEVYTGRNGYSLRLYGLEKSFNEKAASRAIVVHGAPYVNASSAGSGRIGRSWGCPAVPAPLAKPIINTIKGGSLVFAYYPDNTWLKRSQYLHCTGTIT